MKKALFLMLALCLLLTLAAASAAGDTWHCDTCDEDRNTPFCPICGTKRPEAEPTWVCPTCGQSYPLAYQFCPDDGTPQPGSEAPAQPQTERVWPVIELTGPETRLTSLQQGGRHQSYHGPDSQKYPGAGAYTPRIVGANILYRDGNYALVDLQYATQGRKCIYFRYLSLTNPNAPEWDLTGHPAHVIERYQPRYGPGMEYDPLTQNFSAPSPLTQRMPVIRTENVFVEAGTPLLVFCESRDWVFAEFECSLGLVRAWLPVDAVQAD
ncbi:MAG: hypothetical protein IKP40_05495 [Clostridia bacterium]|nr:hypothetical protein [Clostridia bacterium]